MQINVEVIEGRVIAKSRISHMGESSGTKQLFNRQDIIYKGKNVRIPYISANSIKGIMRRRARDLFLEIIGKRQEDFGAYTQYFLSSGGQQARAKTASDKGVQGGVVDWKYEQKVRNLVPYFSMFGGVVDQHFFEGRLSVSDLIPFACQTQFMTGVESNINVNSVLSDNKNTTMDDSKVEGEKGTGDKDDKQKRQMRYESEVMKPGTVMRYKFKIKPQATDLDRGAFWSSLRQFLNDPVVGGNNRIGHGELHFLDLTVDNELADAYETYLGERKEDILGYLDELNSRWG